MGKIVKCKNCYASYDLDDLKDGACPYCEVKYQPDKQDDMSKNQDSKVENSKKQPSKAIKVLKTIGSVLWLIIKCVGYLVYCLLFLWLVFDIFDTFTKKKK